jgi:tetratricopeptide (TPR) repeat protein
VQNLKKMQTRFNKNYVSVIGFSLITLCLVAQSKSQVKPINASPSNINMQVYRQSLSLGDYNTAINAIHYLLASDPVKYANFQDTLALVYLQNNNLRQGYLIADALLKNRGYSDMRLEIKAICAKGLQQPVEAINAYATLFSNTKTPAFGFEELQLQYSIRRLAETITTGNALLQSLPVKDSSRINILKADGKTVQQVSLKAAVNNIIGLAYIDLKNKNNAILNLDAALKENPDFEQAKNNKIAALALTN